MDVTELYCRFGSGGAETQRYVPDENILKEMRFNVALLVNVLRLINNFSIYLLEFVIIVKNLLKSTTL